MNIIQKKYGALKYKWRDAVWFKVLSFVSYYSYMALLFLFTVVCYLIAFLCGEGGNNKKLNGMTSQKDKSADDIWDQTSGNDYYKNDPPDKFS